MKIRIKAKKIRLTLFLPLSLIKCKFVYQPLINNYIEKDNIIIDKKKKDNAKTLAEALYSTLKFYKEKTGKFTLVDVVAADGTIVKIII